MKRTAIAIVICLNALVYSAVETCYFGSHFWPSSPSEVLADGIGLVILSLGLMLAAPRDK